ncbi:Acyl-N-acyltransferase [Cordyceps militaris]|uniref:Acyl-N-acyltransferase n=1 Tax=Cordyceps militaris TaxID=73501 RepID=A0A2H4SU13_CORMI|nr:Acyl-N-acyltransferase [Cordyceps militaris]
MSDGVIRHARKEDVPIILDLIQALADYEKESDANKATVETLTSTIAFAPSGPASDPNTTACVPNTEATSASRPARCLLLADPAGETVAMALYFYNYSTWRACPGIYLEDLFVRPSARGRGYGKALLVQLAKEVVAFGGARLEWSVLKWNEPSIKFYEKIGAQGMHEWMTMRVTDDGLTKLAQLLD